MTSTASAAASAESGAGEPGATDPPGTAEAGAAEGTAAGDLAAVAGIAGRGLAGLRSTRTFGEPGAPLRRRSRRVRPYALTGGRTETRYHLLVETLISVPRYDPDLAGTLMPESRALYERARTPLSIAELSVLLAIPLGVVRVLVSDLAAQGAVFIHPTAHALLHDRNVLERILHGLQELPV